MACATCKGTKQVKRLARPTWRRLNEGVSPEPGYIREPCPDCAPTPFARSFGRNIRIQGSDGYEREIVATAEGLAADATADLNDAVEAREAKLRGPLALAAKAVAEAIQLVRERQGFVDLVPMLISLSDILDGHTDFVSADEYGGLAFELGTWQAAVEDLSTMLDAVTDENPTERAAIVGFLRARGLAEEPAYEAIIDKLRGALREGINHIAQNGGSSFPAFRTMTTAFDVTSKNAVKLEVANRRRPPVSLRDVSDENLVAEVKRREALEKIVHVFAEHEYGSRDGRTTVTGRSMCGLDLEYGGRWNAITRNDFNAEPTRADCGRCRTAAAFHDAVLHDSGLIT